MSTLASYLLVTSLGWSQPNPDSSTDEPVDTNVKNDALENTSNSQKVVSIGPTWTKI